MWKLLQFQPLKLEVDLQWQWVEDRQGGKADLWQVRNKPYQLLVALLANRLQQTRGQ